MNRLDKITEIPLRIEGEDPKKIHEVGLLGTLDEANLLIRGLYSLISSGDVDREAIEHLVVQISVPTDTIYADEGSGRALITTEFLMELAREHS